MTEMTNEELRAINAQARKQAIWRRRNSMKQSIFRLGEAAAIVYGCMILNGIGFVSDAFCLILMEGAMLWAAFKIGGLWSR